MKTVELVNNIRDLVREYSYNVYGDCMEDYMNSMVKSELKNVGIINGDDEMIWKSPSQDLYFEVSREYSNSKMAFEGGYQYICTLNIKNDVRMPLASIKFTEIDTIRILDSFVNFCDNVGYMGGSNPAYIGINPSNTTLENYTIVLESIKLGNLDGVLFRIEKYNPYYQSIANVCNTALTLEQLNDLAFHLFFAILIDIEVPIEYDEIMFRIEDFVTTENYWIYERRRRELEELSKVHPEKGNYAKSFISNNSYYIESFLTDNECYAEETEEEPSIVSAPMNTVTIENKQIKPTITRRHKLKIKPITPITK